MTDLTLILCNQHLYAYDHQQAETHSLPIQGESGGLRLRSPQNLRHALNDLHERLAPQSALTACLVYDQASVPLLHEHSLWQDEVVWHWECLRLERLTQQYQIKLSANPTAQQLQDLLLAAVRQSQAPQTPARNASPPANSDDPAALRVRCQALEAQLHTLRQNTAQNQSYDGEQLLAFLPALYQQVFSLLNGADLAMLVGRAEPYCIESPYQEPSEMALAIKQREFCALPREQQRSVVAFARQFGTKLRARPKMQALVSALEDET